MVGAPPEAIGKFGGETDNWVWPRHTIDFSLFRIYAGADNLPADYSPNNKPYAAPRALNISLDGTAEGDFTMVLGFPGRTDEYLPASAVAQMMGVNDPARVGQRGIALKVMERYMRADEGTKLQYASKYAGIANYWKKWKGEMEGLEAAHAVEKKRSYEAAFTQRLDAKGNEALKKQYGGILPHLDSLYAAQAELTKANDYYIETFNRLLDMPRIALQSNEVVSAYNATSGKDLALTTAIEKLRNSLTEFRKVSRPDIDREMFEALMAAYYKNVGRKYCPSSFYSPDDAPTSDWKSVGEAIYVRSIIFRGTALESLLADSSRTKIVATLRGDPAVMFAARMYDMQQIGVVKQFAAIQNAIAADLRRSEERR